MAKKAISLLCAIVLLLGIFAVSATAATSEQESAAQKLYSLGLMAGVSNDSNGNPIFDLDRTPTRAEAITLFVRLIGKETEALSGEWHTPFTDVTIWAQPYVGYAYSHGITRGVSATEFGSNSNVTAAQYLTFILRTIGYRDGSDFEWSKSFALTDILAITHGSYSETKTAFTRGDAAVVSLAALSARINGGDIKLIERLVSGGAVSEAAAIKAGLLPDNASPTPAPNGNAAPPALPAAPELIGSYTVGEINYTLLSVSSSDTHSYKFDGTAAKSSDVFTSGSTKLIKIEMPEGATSGTLKALYNGQERASFSVSFSSAGKAAPAMLYGVTPMKFSEFFYDVTGSGVPAAPSTTVFAASGAVSEPEKFITQGTRTGNNGSVTYAAGDALEKVDAISSATYGDSVHFVPNGNLTLDGSDRNTATDPNASILGITRAEVGISFDLYANAVLLNKAGKGTAQSANVLSKYADFTLISTVYQDGAIKDKDGGAKPDLGVYKVKYMLIDGNWGKRVSPDKVKGSDKSAAPKALPGTGLVGGDTEEVSYGGNWGDKVTGFAFGGTLEANYDGANYWDNFAEYIYGGYITDETGHTEPLVFLQNIFTHRMHTDFDIAISPSRFSRLNNLAKHGSYQVKILAWGFEDIDFEVDLKDYINASVALDGAASIQVTNSANPIVLTVTGVEQFAEQNASILKGTTLVSKSDYGIDLAGTTATITLKPSLLSGSYQGSYTLIIFDTDTITSKPITFTLVSPARPSLTVNSDLTGGSDAGSTADAAISVSKAANKLYFSIADFGKALVVTGRSGLSSVTDNETNAAVLVTDVFKRDSADSAYYINLSALTVGKTYKVTANATGFNSQIYYITITA